MECFSISAQRRSKALFGAFFSPVVAERMSSSSNVKRGPKGPTAYHKFLMSELPKIKEQHPDMSPRQRLKEGAKRWHVFKAEKAAEGALTRFAEHAAAAGSTPEAFMGFETAVMEPPTVLAVGEVPSEEEKEEKERTAMRRVTAAMAVPRAPASLRTCYASTHACIAGSASMRAGPF